MKKEGPSPTPAVLQKEYFTIAGYNAVPMATDLYLPQGLTKAPVVVYAHGINGFKDWGGMPLIAEKIAAAGFAFLAFNFSHNGTTPARPQSFFDLAAYAQDRYLIRQYDLEQVRHFIQNTAHGWPLDGEKIYLLGHSRGGVDALLYAADHTAIKGLVTWSAPSLATTPWQRWSEAEMNRWRKKGVHHLENKRTGQQLPIEYGLYEEYRVHRYDALNTEAKARAFDRPWLIVHGEADEAVFVAEAYQWKSWQPQAAVEIIAGADHVYQHRHPWTVSSTPPQSQLAEDATIRFLRQLS